MYNLTPLKKSPLFMLSLSSKELFHSNFIAWLWEKYPERIYKIFEEKMEYKPKVWTEVKVEREKKNKDLTVCFDDGKNVLIIENKVKSIPDENQLKKYREEIIKANKKDEIKYNYILMSIIKPNFPMAEMSGEWKYIDYKSFIGQLKEIKLDGDYDNSLVQDYCSFTEKLISESKDSIEKHTPFLTVQEYKDLSEYRIHDLIIKQRYSKLAGEIEKLFRENNCLEQILDKKIDVGFTNGSGLVDFKVIIKDDFMIGIQLQGRMLRYVAEIKYDKTKLSQLQNKMEKIMDTILNKAQLWFKNGGSSPEHLRFSKSLEEVATAKSKNKKEICNFTKTFFYQYLTLKQDCTYDDIAVLFLNYYNYIQENRKNFEDLLI